ncbi:MAG: hypothetical protein QM674_16740 [Burkholderiaceae bacterium]
MSATLPRIGSTGPSWARWRRDPLAIGLAASVLLHVIVMGVRFTAPEPLRFKPFDSQIEVVLLNARTRNAPLAPEVLAQVNQEGGGDRDQGRAKSPLPAMDQMRDGDDLREQRQRIDQLERQQRQMLSMARQAPTVAAPRQRTQDAPPTPETAADDEATRAIARLQAQIDRQISDYNKRPKRLTYGVNAKGVNYARYVDEWADRIERIGTDLYPREARGKMYDSLICTVEIDKHGNVVDVVVNKPSKYPVLNRAVKQIVYAGAPYARFTPEMAKDGDILQIVRTWTFTNKGLETTAARK